MKKIVLTGGGTAGHIYPALAVAERLDGWEIHFIGGDGMEKEILKKEKNIVFHEVSCIKLERKLTAKNLLIPFKLVEGIIQAKKLLQEIKPNIIFSKGGYASVPTVLAAHSLGIPIISHESDLSMGLANKIILRYCTIMCTSFKETATGDKCVFTGQPIRKKVFKGNKNAISGNFDENLPNLLVIGGSLGAKFLNEIVWKNLDALTSKFNVVHISGKQAERTRKHTNYLQVKYADNIGDYYAFADIILSRAGAGAINEFVALKKPALLIPLSKAASRGDQIENARLFSKNGYADMMEEENYSIDVLMEKLENLYKNSKKYQKNMQKLQNFDACDKIIDLINKNCK